MNRYILLFFFLACSASMHAQTIAEKKAGLKYSGSDLTGDMQEYLNRVNQDIDCYHRELETLYAKTNELYLANASECAYKDLLEQINAVKRNIIDIESNWRELSTKTQKEGYALWYQPSTTLEQLVIDYGSHDYVYLIPPEVGSIVVSVNSSLPIPRAAWSTMLETILTQNGVGIKQLNPFLRQLYLVKTDNSGLKLITNKRQDLFAFPANERIAYVLTPEPSDVRRTWLFLEKFVNPQSTVLQMIGRDILIVAQISEIQELLKLYDFVAMNRGDKEYKAIALNRVNAEEMATILSAIFGGLIDESVVTDIGGDNNAPRNMPGPSVQGNENGLKIIPLNLIARAVFLVGTREEIRRAENIIRDIEEQVGESREKVIYWYSAKHSNPEDLAEILYRIYYLMLTTGVGFEEAEAQISADQVPPPPPPPDVLNLNKPFLRRPYDEGFFLDNRFIVNRTPPRDPRPINQNRENFIVDPTTNSIVMVVEADILPKLKELLKKLDIPKRMVQIEVLLFEKRITAQNNFGLNLLRIGSAAKNVNKGSVLFNDLLKGPQNAGVFEFLISHKKHAGIPAYDLAYRFLISQDDVRINASPSVLALNQTQAIIEIEEEISVNTGIFQVETISGVTLKDSFARALYGIKIDVTPTIHVREFDDESCDDGCDYVTLLTDITFQTFKPALNDRPDVTTRHITNEVDIPSGQTVILGGLRRKTSHDTTDAIPFLGELPGLGKLFSTNEMNDESTEMFIFITPKIIYDPCEDLERLRNEEMCRRPGDIPEFLCEVVEAEEWERTHLIQGSMLMLFGRQLGRCVCPTGEWDGR